jgi:hypothetical protein
MILFYYAGDITFRGSFLFCLYDLQKNPIKNFQCYIARKVGTTAWVSGSLLSTDATEFLTVV